MSKWHPKSLQWNPKFWKLRYGFALHWSITIWGKHVFLHVAIATDGCNVIGRNNFLAPKLQIWYLCIIMRTTSLRPVTIPLEICTVWCTKLRKHFNAIMEEVFYCFITAIGFAWRYIRLQWRKKICSAHAKQGGCRVRQQWELGVRFWLLEPHWSSCQKIKMMLCALFYCDLWKQKFQHVAFLFRTLAPHLTEQGKVFTRDVLTLHRWMPPWNCAPISSLMPLLNPSLKLISKSLIVN